MGLAGDVGGFGSRYKRNPETVTHRLDLTSFKQQEGYNEDKLLGIPTIDTLQHEVFSEATSCPGAIWLCYGSCDATGVGVPRKSSYFARLFCRSTTIITSVPLVSVVPDTTTASVHLPVNCICNRYPIARQCRRFY